MSTHRLLRQDECLKPKQSLTLTSNCGCFLAVTNWIFFPFFFGPGGIFIHSDHAITPAGVRVVDRRAAGAPRVTSVRDVFCLWRSADVWLGDFYQRCTWRGYQHLLRDNDKIGFIGLIYHTHARVSSQENLFVWLIERQCFHHVWMIVICRWEWLSDVGHFRCRGREKAHVP